MKIKRVIRVFRHSDDELVTDILISSQQSNRIKKLFTANFGDDKYYGIYEIDLVQFNIIVNFLPELKNYPLNLFELYFTAFKVSSVV